MYFQSPERTIEVYTYNRSQLFMRDEDDNQQTSIDTTYNWDTKEEEWNDGKSSYEKVEVKCQAYGGRPIPEFKWYINK